MIRTFGIVPASAGLSAFLRSRLGRTTVAISTEGIRIEERGAWKTTTLASLNASEITDIDYSTADSMVGSARLSGSPVVGERTERVLTSLKRFVKGRGITVKTRQGLTTFGKGLADEEIGYLHSVTIRALKGGG